MTFDAATEPEPHVALSLDVQRALESGVAKLQSEFSDTFDAETVQRLVYASYDKLAAQRDGSGFPAATGRTFRAAAIACPGENQQQIG